MKDECRFTEWDSWLIALSTLSIALYLALNHFVYKPDVERRLDALEAKLASQPQAVAVAK